MAGEDRYSWLDEDVAELLLRGEPADSLTSLGAADEAARGDALRLAAALGAVSVGVPELCSAGRPAESPFIATARPMPGEEAALAAFREARAVGAEPDACALTAVVPLERFRRSARPFSRRRRSGRPLRAGLAAALAVCALGGVAVAAGTGVLPTPFDRGSRGPLPAASVSAAEPPSAYTAGPSLPPDEDSPSPLSSRPSAPDGTSGGGSPVPDGGTPGTPGGGGQAPDAQEDLLGEDLPPQDKGDRRKLQLALDLCRRYEEGALLGKAQQQLERLVGGSGAVESSCAWLLQETGGAGSADGGDDHPGHANGDHKDDDGDDGDDDSHGHHPGGGSDGRGKGGDDSDGAATAPQLIPAQP